MRWDLLFDDLSAQHAAAEMADLRVEVADRIRRERASLTFLDRLAGAEGDLLSLVVQGVAGVVHGQLLDLGQDWVLVDSGLRGQELVALGAVRSVEGLSNRADDRPGVLARRFGLGYVLRRLSRDRTACCVVDQAGTQHTGTIDRVGKDFVELALHDLDTPRRGEHLRGVRVLPFSGLALVRSR